MLREMEEIKDNAHSDLEELSRRRAEVYLTEQFQKLMDEARECVTELEPEELDMNDKTLLLLDVREPEEFASGYIGAQTHLTIPRGKLEFAAIKKIANKYGHDANIVTYCYRGPRGLLAAYQLKKMGFANVRNLKNGILNWLGSGYAIQSYLGELRLTVAEQRGKA
jgi:rhodanese-related sulfurtransferase